MTTAISIIDLTAEEDRELQGLALDITVAVKGLRYALVDLGKACIRAHEILAPKRSGAFADWVENYCDVSIGWAYASMRVYREFGNIAPGCKIDSKAMLLLASPSVPPEVREQAVEESKHQPVTAKRAKELVDGTRVGREVPSEPADTGDEAAVLGLRESGVALDSADGRCGAVQDDEDYSPASAEVAPRQAKAQAKASGPVEPNEIGGMIHCTTEEMGITIEGQPVFKVAAYLNGVELWIAQTRERLGIK